MKKKIGICFGGYCPLHQGHLDVIMQAKKESDLCYVVVCGYDNEPRSVELGLPLYLRTALVAKFFEKDEIIKVLYVDDTELGIDESMSENNWIVWTNKIVHNIAENLDPTIHGNMNPESYIKALSYIEEKYEITFYVGEQKYVNDLNNIGFDAVLVGYDGTTETHRANNISGSMIRENPLRYWDKIAWSYQPVLSKSILVLGTASEGKTTLVKDIANYFNMPSTYEYAREYMAERNMQDDDLKIHDFIAFMKGQNDLYWAAKNSPKNKGVIISDTDNLVTLMYAKAYTTNPEMHITPDEYEKVLVPIAEDYIKNGMIKWDKIFLVEPHGKFVNDGSRYMGQASIEERQKNDTILKDLIKKYYPNADIQILNGTYLDHFIAVKKYVESLYE